MTEDDADAGANETVAWDDDGAGGAETVIVPPAPTEAAPDLAWSHEEPVTEALTQPWRSAWTIAGVLLVCMAVAAFVIGVVGWTVAQMHDDAPSPRRAADTTVPAVALPPVAPTPTVSPTVTNPDPDAQFLQRLTDAGVAYTNPTGAINMGKVVCADFDKGQSYADVAALDPQLNMAAIIAAAVNTFCTDHADLLPTPAPHTPSPAAAPAPPQTVTVTPAPPPPMTVTAQPAPAQLPPTDSNWTPEQLATSTCDVLWNGGTQTDAIQFVQSKTGWDFAPAKRWTTQATAVKCPQAGR